ncbi:hypothetical protein Bpfe_015099 [Biomphalaria pfeifferi]|uniref:Uncharacterized protein n=1 Tax=Biomphalaria pfeifferi TaxID=112525 RepID=A0AAD8BJ47_BIOPF|nr:hypothetical protein Bpfe_015099 [Biomphalaria pfeifferi]
MASSNPRGYAVDPKVPKAQRSYAFNDEETKLSFSCGNGSLFLKLSSFLLFFSGLLQLIAIAAPYWAAGWRRSKMSWHEGVWMTCQREEMENKWICGAYDYFSSRPGVPVWYDAVQAMGLMSIVIFLPAVLLNVFYTMHPKGTMYKGLLWFNFALTLSTALLPLTMVIVFAAGHPGRYRFPIPYLDEDHDDDPFEFHFSFAFEIIASFVSLCAFILEIMDFTKNK